MAALENLRIFTLGTAEVWLNGAPVQWRADSARELFFYLLCQPTGHTREHIIETLWNTKPGPASSNRFRVTVHRIRVALGWSGAVQEEYGRYRLSPEIVQAADFQIFAQALVEAQREISPLRRLERYQHALALYRGEFLPLEEGEWARETREQLRSAFVQAQLELAHLLCGQGNCPGSLEAQSRALQVDPYLGENHHQNYMRCLWHLKGKYASIEYYRRFVRFLHEEIGDTPMPETIQLAEQIKGDLEAYQTEECPFARRLTQNEAPVR